MWEFEISREGLKGEFLNIFFLYMASSDDVHSMDMNIFLFLAPCSELCAQIVQNWAIFRYLEEPLSDYESEYIGDFRQISFTSLKER